MKRTWAIQFKSPNGTVFDTLYVSSDSVEGVVSFLKKEYDIPAVITPRGCLTADLDGKNLVVAFPIYIKPL